MKGPVNNFNKRCEKHTHHHRLENHQVQQKVCNKILTTSQWVTAGLLFVFQNKITQFARFMASLSDHATLGNGLEKKIVGRTEQFADTCEISFLQVEVFWLLFPVLGVQRSGRIWVQKSLKQRCKVLQNGATSLACIQATGKRTLSRHISQGNFGWMATNYAVTACFSTLIALHVMVVMMVVVVEGGRKSSSPPNSAKNIPKPALDQKTRAGRKKR